LQIESLLTCVVKVVALRVNTANAGLLAVTVVVEVLHVGSALQGSRRVYVHETDLGVNVVDMPGLGAPTNKGLNVVVVVDVDVCVSVVVEVEVDMYDEPVSVFVSVLVAMYDEQYALPHSCPPPPRCPLGRWTAW
jgi:hypothetical protein